MTISAPLHPAPVQPPRNGNPSPPVPAPKPGPRPATRLQRAVLFDRRRHQGRELAEALVARAEHLLPEDRALLSAVYRDGTSAKEIALLTGESPRAVRRRIRSLAQRVLDPRFAFVLVHRDDWPPTRRKVATEMTLHGRPMRETARRLNLSLHAVRRHADAIRAVYEARMKSDLAHHTSRSAIR